MNAVKFFDRIRISVFGGRLTQGVVNTCNAIFSECEKRGVKDLRMIAYIFATAHREAYSALKNPEWLPVREGFAKTNEGAIAAVTKLYNQKRISKNYALPQANGLSYYGRGHVQITFGDNYKRIGTAIGTDIYHNPDKVLELPVSIEILVRGMLNGWFTGKRLGEYFNADSADAFNARKIVNGLDAARQIADAYLKFYAALTEK